MSFFSSAVDVLKTLVIVLGAGLAIWGVINLLEGYGSDNPAANGQEIIQAIDIKGMATYYNPWVTGSFYTYTY